MAAPVDPAGPGTPPWGDGPLLPWLLTGLEPATFFAEYWERRPLLLRGAPGRFAGLFSPAAFDRASGHCDHLKVSRRDPRGRPQEYPIAPEGAAAAFAAGGTLCASGIHGDPALDGFLRAFAGEVASAGEVAFNAYYSPDGKGFALHLDDHPVWILQIAGSKRWRYSPEPLINPLTTVTFPPGVQEVTLPWCGTLPRPDESRFLEGVLAPGDLLYLPAGTWHEAAAIGSSLALTLATDRATPLDLIQEAFLERVRHRRDLQRNLPGAWAREADAADRRAALRAELDSALGKLRAVVADIGAGDLERVWRHRAGVAGSAPATAGPAVPAALDLPPPLDTNPTLGRARPIPRRHGLDREAFAAAHLAGEGLPVLVTDAMDHWPARGKWDLDFFRDRYGDDTLVANSPTFLEDDLGLTPVKMRLRLGDYIDYIRDPSRPPRGAYLHGDWAALQRNRVPLYDPAYRVFTRHPELAADIPSSPYFTDDLLPLLPASARRFLDATGSPIHYLFFAPKGSVAFLHTDYWGTHAYLAQFQGRKLCVLFAPGDGDHLYQGAVRNPLAPDLERFPRFRQATPYAGILEAGELLFVPSGWWHFVVGLETSLTYSYDFFNTSNMAAYFTHFFAGLGQLLTTDPGRLPPPVQEAIATLRDAAARELADLAAPPPPPR